MKVFSDVAASLMGATALVVAVTAERLVTAANPGRRIWFAFWPPSDPPVVPTRSTALQGVSVALVLGGALLLTGPGFTTWFFAAGALVIVINLVPRGLVLGLHNARRIGQR